jgi:hypothetical protein
MSESDARSTVTLRSRRPPGSATPLTDENVRRIVISSVEGIAERMGIPLLAVESDEDSVTLTVAAPQLVAMSFAAELRRVTDRWHRTKFGTPIWSDRP